mgnify:CR=1 FL=1
MLNRSVTKVLANLQPVQLFGHRILWSLLTVCNQLKREKELTTNDINIHNL